VSRELSHIAHETLHRPESWHLTLFRCPGGPSDLLARVSALKQLLGIGLVVRGEWLQGTPRSMLATRTCEALSRAVPLLSKPLGIQLRGIDIRCPRGHRFTHCELRQYLTGSIERYISPATAGKLLDRANTFSPGQLVPAQAPSRRSRDLIYALLPNATWDDDIIGTPEGQAEVQQCDMTRYGLSILMKKARVRMLGNDMSEQLCQGQILLLVAYPSGTDATETISLSVRACISMCLRGHAYLDLRGVIANFRCSIDG
jgi:hypothetical protein